MATESDEQYGERGDPITMRTQLAIAAEQEAFKAQMGVMALKRVVRRTRLLWGSLGLIGMLLLAGFTARGRVDQFVTKDRVEEIAARQDLGDRKVDKVCESLESIKETVTRIARQQDDYVHALMTKTREHGR